MRFVIIVIVKVTAKCVVIYKIVVWLSMHARSELSFSFRQIFNITSVSWVFRQIVFCLEEEKNCYDKIYTMSTPPMFGCVVPGRLVSSLFVYISISCVNNFISTCCLKVQFDAQQVSETQVIFNLPCCDQINHVALFLTGSQPLPDGCAAAIYLCWPKPTPAWFMLGHISNDKPSVIFKVAKVGTVCVSCPGELILALIFVLLFSNLCVCVLQVQSSTELTYRVSINKPFVYYYTHVCQLVRKVSVRNPTIPITPFQGYMGHVVRRWLR